MKLISTENLPIKHQKNDGLIDDHVVLPICLPWNFHENVITEKHPSVYRPSSEQVRMLKSRSKSLYIDQRNQIERESNGKGLQLQLFC